MFAQAPAAANATTTAPDRASSYYHYGLAHLYEDMARLVKKPRWVGAEPAHTVAFPEKAAVHRRERLAGRFDRAVTMPVEINPEGVKAEYRDGILALYLPRAESEKPKSIKVA